MMATCVFAGSFDPVTVGHEDLIRRAAKLCEHVLVTVMYNPAKTGCFGVEQRLALLRKVTADIPNVEVDAWNGLLVDYVKKTGAAFVVRGVRSSADLESEANLAEVNRRLMPGLETVLLVSKPELACISSSVVREAALFNADFSAFVPSCILEDVREHFAKG